MPFINMSDFQREAQPYFIYGRLTLNAPTNYFLFPIDYGFWYLLRKVHIKYPEVDQTGAIFGPHLRVEMYERASNKWPQNAPVSFELFATPGSAGVTITAGGQMTATGPKNAKLINKIFPYRDNLQLEVSGQNTVTPAVIDICLLGYLIPEKKLAMWKGDEDA